MVMLRGSAAIERFKAHATRYFQIPTLDDNGDLMIHDIGTHVEFRGIHGKMPFRISSLRTEITFVNCDLIDLEGFPDEIRNLSMARNANLRAWGGYVKVVQGSINIGSEHHTSLIGMPHTIRDCLYLDGCRLENLQGLSTSIGGEISLADCGLREIEGLPEVIKQGSLNLLHNPLISLKGLPKQIHSNLVLSWNKDLPLLRLLACDVKGSLNIYGDDRILEELSSTLEAHRAAYQGGQRNAALMACQRDLMAIGHGSNARW